MEPAHHPSYLGHSRTTSLPVIAYPEHFGGPLVTRPHLDRRSTSPPTGVYHIQPNVPSPLSYMVKDVTSSRCPSLAHARSTSTSNIHKTHSRNSSTASIDASMLTRYGYPTYRQSPTPQPMPSGAPLSRVPSAMSHLAPIAMPDGQVQSYPQRRRTTSPPANRSKLSNQVEFDPVLDLQTSTALEYLTASNPKPSLAQRTVEPLRGQETHFWYDIRNVRAWSDFCVNAISALPDLLAILQIAVTKRSLPEPAKVNTMPETPAQLTEAHALHHAVKLNAALKLTQGSDKHMAMRALKSAPGSRQQPEFVSSYQSDSEKTIYGDGRGRVVGIVKCCDQWNSGLRSGSPTDKVKYLQSLAQLHRFMREHGTRYGFIITEIELVCVRAGGSPSENTTHPLFGFVEVATPVEIATSGKTEDGDLRMTAGLALWWLHMLASREQQFPGQYHWKLDVGPPGDLSRKRHLERDSWMPKPTQSEKRAAKRNRGWVFPDEPLSKRECGKVRKTKG